MPRQRTPGITGLSIFFACSTVISAYAASTLLFPGSALDAPWRLNPDAHRALQSIGLWAVLLMSSVSVACGAAAAGLWQVLRWGRWLALAVLGTNLLGDLLSALLRDDPRALIGVPMGGALIAYLSLRRVRALFEAG